MALFVVMVEKRVVMILDTNCQKISGGGAKD